MTGTIGALYGEVHCSMYTQSNNLLISWSMSLQWLYKILWSDNATDALSFIWVLCLYGILLSTSLLGYFDSSLWFCLVG